MKTKERERDAMPEFYDCCGSEMLTHETSERTLDAAEIEAMMRRHRPDWFTT